MLNTKRCSWKFHKIHRKTPVPESLSGLGPATSLLKRLWHRCFPAYSAKFLRTPFSQNTSGGCFWKVNNFPVVPVKQSFKIMTTCHKTNPAVCWPRMNQIFDKWEIRVGTKYLTNGKNTWNQAKKIVKDFKQVSPNTMIAFSSIVIWKDRKVVETNSRLKNYCSKKT